jgi:hypothetical protein
VADVQRAGRVGRDELDHDALAGARARAPVPPAQREDARHDRAARVRLEAQVDEAGPAISIDSTSARTPGSGSGARLNASATSRGLRLSAFAPVSAKLVA